MDNTESKTMSRRKKIILAILISLAVVMIVVWNFVLPMIAATVGGSFGYGFPSGSGGRAIRSVEIDVDPQVVYRIDDHRFFTFENYVSCSSGGFVYYNDTNKRIKKLAGIEGSDKKFRMRFLSVSVMMFYLLLVNLSTLLKIMLLHILLGMLTISMVTLRTSYLFRILMTIQRIP